MKGWKNPKMLQHLSLLFVTSFGRLKNSLPPKNRRALTRWWFQLFWNIFQSSKLGICPICRGWDSNKNSFEVSPPGVNHLAGEETQKKNKKSKAKTSSPRQSIFEGYPIQRFKPHHTGVSLGLQVFLFQASTLQEGISLGNNTSNMFFIYMGVEPKIRGFYHKWMVYNGKPY